MGATTLAGSACAEGPRPSGGAGSPASRGEGPPLSGGAGSPASRGEGPPLSGGAGSRPSGGAVTPTKAILSTHGFLEEEIETMPAEQLRSAALARLRDTLARARGLPFYRERLAHVEPAAIGSFADFAAAVPTFTKADLIAELRRRGTWETGIEALTGPPAAVVLTSGTLGWPTFAQLGRFELEDGSAREVQRELWMDGMRPGMRVACQYPAWHHLSMLDGAALQAIGARVICPWGTFLPRFCDHAIELLACARPEYVLSVTTMLHAILERALARGIEPAALFEPVRFAMVAGEPVSPGQRRRLIELLGLEDLFERGGGSDGLWGGAECPAHAGHHVWSDHHHVEVLDVRTRQPLPPGCRGTVVVSNLTAERSLYVRFDTEDLGELLDGPCQCGRTHPRIELYGRLADCVRVRGRLLAPYDARAVLDEIPELVGVPIVLVRDGDEMERLQVRLDGSACAEQLAEIAAEHLRAGLGIPVEVRFGGPLPRRFKARMSTSLPRQGPGGARWARR